MRRFLFLWVEVDFRREWVDFAGGGGDFEVLRGDFVSKLGEFISSEDQSQKTAAKHPALRNAIKKKSFEGNPCKFKGNSKAIASNSIKFAGNSPQVQSVDYPQI